MSDALRASLTRIRDEADAGLRALGASGGDPVEVETYMTAPLGPNGERTPAWLVELNRQRRAAAPSGYVGQDGPDFDDNPDTTSRTALILVSAIVDPRVLERSDLDAAQRAAVQEACNVRAWGTLLGTLHKDEVTGYPRLPVTWVGGDPPFGKPGDGVLALPPNTYPTEQAIESAVRRLYELAYYPLPS